MKMKTKGKGLAVALVVMMLVAMPALASLNNSSNSSVNENESITTPVPETLTPTPSQPIEESNNNTNTTTDTDTKANANETEIIDDEIPLPPLSENVRIIGKDSFSANETPEFVIEIEQAFIDAVSDADSGKPVEVQISVEDCNGVGIELSVEEVSSNKYCVTIPNNKTGTEELTSGTYKLVVEVGKQSVEHSFKWGLGVEPEMLLSENVNIIGNDSFGANDTPEFVIEIEQAFMASVSDADSGKPVEIQIYVEGCNGTRLELFVEEEEASPSSNISIFRVTVTIPNNKTGLETKEITPGTYTLVVEVGEQYVEHPFEWGLETEPKSEEALILPLSMPMPMPMNLSDNLKFFGNDSFSANETPEFVIEIQNDFIASVANLSDSEPAIQIHAEDSEGNRIEVIVEEISSSSNITNVSVYKVTIPNHKTGSKFKPGTYKLVVELGGQAIEYPFEWGPQPTIAPALSLTTAKKHFVLNENPVFKFKFNYKTKAKAEAETNETGLKALALDISEPKKALKTWVTSEETIKTAVYYKDELLDLEPEIEKIGEGDFSIKIPSQRAYRAGLYKLKVELVTDNKTYVEEQDFTWGVLAINTHKSIYLPDETAFIGIAVLDDEGHMVCDADVTLTITDPGNKDSGTVLSTGNGLIRVSPQCSVYGVTNLPDYYTNYVVGGVGTYVMTLTAVTPDGTKSITDEFTVQNSVEFDVARDGPTRIYPPVPYVMKFTIKANKNYTGLIKEYVPALFKITPQEGLTVTTVGDTKILTWNKNLVKGETYNIAYEFDAPDVSPYLFVLGRLQIGGFEEKRDWMIASDADTTVKPDSATSSDEGDVLAKIVADGGTYDGVEHTQYTDVTFENLSGAESISAVTLYFDIEFCDADFQFNIDITAPFSSTDVCIFDGVTGMQTCDFYAAGIDTVDELNNLEMKYTGLEVPDEKGPDDGGVDWVYLAVTYSPAADTTPPTYTNDGDNSSGAVTEGTIVETHVYWTDADSALSKAVLRTNKTGSWENESWHTFTGDPEWANITFDTAGLGGKTICWVQWANDTASPENWNTSMPTTAHCFNVVAADITPPASITNLLNTTYAPTYINWSWTNPADTDFNHTMVHINGNWKENVSSPLNYSNATGLSPNTNNIISTHTVDTSGNVNLTWVNHSAWTAPSEDTTAPASITNLHNTTYAPTYINWSWTNPADTDFNHTMVYIKGNWKENVSSLLNYSNATGLSPNTNNTISTHTVDTSGNVNQTWVNQSAWTAPAPDTTPPIITDENLNRTELKTGETVRLNATTSDPDSDVTEVKFKIKYPDETSANFSATEITTNYWESNFSDTSQIGEYNWTDTYATSGGGTNHTTPAKTFHASDGTKPVPSNIGANETAAGTPCLFHAYWTDNVGLANYTFAWNDTGTGEWVNDSVVPFSGTGNWSNVTKTLSSTPKTIGWRIYANDTAGNLNDTGIQILTIETALTLRPNAEGTYQTWNTFGTGSYHWDRTADESDATGVNIKGDTTSKETENLTDPTFHNSSTINSVTVYARCTVVGGGSAGEKGVIITRTGGNDYESAAFGLSRTTWTDHPVVYETNPGGGLWTKAQITALEVGSRASTLGSAETMNCSEYWVVVDYTPDTTPPASITNLTNVTGQTWINWTWDNPPDADFNYTMVYLDGVWKTDTSAPFYNATGLDPDASYEIGTHTVDEVGNINETWVNQTTKTEPDIQAPQWSNPKANKTTIYEGDYVKFSANWTDDVDLAGYKFSINQTGTWENSSFTSFSGTSNLSQNITQITASTGTTVQWRFYANDTSDNWNVTDIQSFVVATPPSTPFMIYGRVFYEDGSECLNPTVKINNTNTSITWQADTNASYNYYQLILDTTNISVGNVLEFNTSDGIRYDLTNYMVTQENITDGGLFNFNLTVPEPPKPSSPFIIYGWVFYEDGSKCNGSIVNVTNTNTSMYWLAETNASYNFYQLVLDTTNVSEGNVLSFNTSDGIRYNVTNYTVTQENITDGGLFNFNLTVPTPPSPSAPFIIYGWVNYNNGTACNGPTVNINNTNTSITWQAETNASYNFYQLILDTTNISEGNVLSFNTTDGSQYNVTNHTVTQSNINSGGRFDFNITLPSVADTIPPEWRSQGQNVSQIPVGGSILLYAQGKDLVALDYAVLATNETGTWHNWTGEYGSPMDMQDAGNTWKWSNFTWQNGSIPAGTTVGWRIWYNDTADNWNKIDIMCFEVIAGAAPTVDSITITPDDEPTKDGVQVNPTPGSNKTVNISAVVSDPNGWDNIRTVKANITGPSTVADSPVNLTYVSNSSLMTATYNGTFNMSFYYANGTYTVDVTATDNGSLTGSNSTTFEYQTAIGLELDSTLINFSCSGPIDPGETSEVLGDENVSTLSNATVRNIGNVVIDVNVSGTDMTSAGNVITKDNIAARINDTSYLNMSETRCFDVNMSVNASSLENADFKLFVPYGTPMGNYSGTITLTPVQS